LKNELKKLNTILTKRDKKFLLGLVIFSIFISLIEVIGVGVIMPFIAVATDFSKIYSNKYFKFFYDLFHFNSAISFVVVFGIVLILFYLFRSLINLFYFYTLAKFSQGRYHLLAYRLFENYLGMHYIDFINKNSSNLIKTIITEALNLVQLISNILFMLSEIFVVILIYIMLLWVNWKMTILLTLFLLVNIFLLKKFISTKIKIVGEVRNKMQQKFYEIIISSFGNFKIIKLKGNDDEVLNRFSRASFGFAKANIINATLSQFPRLFLEAIGFSLVAIIVIYLVLKYHSDIRAALPILSMFVLGLYRLMPSVNRIYSNYNEILFRLKSLELCIMI